MDFLIDYQGFEGKGLAIRLGFFGNPRLVASGAPLKRKGQTYHVRDNTGKEIAIRLKKKLLDPLPNIQIGDEILSLAPPFTWREHLIILLPLLILVYLAGLTGGFLGLLGMYLTSRIVRCSQSKVTGYGIGVLISLTMLGIAYSYEWTNNPQFLLDEEFNKEIQQYISGVEVPFHQNNIAYAIKISHFDGKKAISEGRYKDAYEIYRKVLAISYEQGNLMGTGIGLGMLADIFEDMDNHPEAVKAGLLMYKVGLAMEAPMEYGVAEVRLGKLMQEQDRGMAMMWRVKAKDSLKNTPYQSDYIRLLVDLGEDLKWLDRNDDALEVFKEAWSRTSELGNTPDHKWAKWQAALSYARALKEAQECQQAESILKSTLETFSKTERENATYSSFLKDLAACYAQSNKTKLAISTYRKAYAMYEHERSRSLGDHARAKLDKHKYSLTNEFINNLLKIEQVYEALALLETNKARTLTDIQQDEGQREVYGDWTKLERRHAQERIDFHSENDNTINPSPKEEALIKEYLQLLKEQERERRALQVSLQIREVAVSNRLTPIDLRAIQAELPADTAVLAMYVSYTQVGGFVLTNEGLHYVPTTLSWTEYRNAINQLRVALSNPYNDFYVEPAQLLYQKLIKPMTARLTKEVKRVIYSPDDWLSLIPLGVMHDGRKYLVERYAITRVPSLRYFVPERHFKPLRLEIGITCVDPDIEGYRLPFLKDTTKVLKSLYKEHVKQLVGAQCSPRQLEETIAAHPVPAFLHIAAHGSFYEPDPMSSGVYLSPDDSNSTYGFWDARAMGSISLEHVKLVTLSSCQTGMKDPRHPRDVFGIVRALFFSGAHRVLAPLWAVQDRATAKLEQEFYKNQQNHGIPAIALQKAQSTLIAHPKYNHPYYWAGFVLTESPA